MEKAVKCTQNVLPDFVQVYSTKIQKKKALAKLKHSKTQL